MTELNELHEKIVQSYKNVRSYPASSIGGHPNTNTMLDLTIQRIIAEYNSQIVNPDKFSEEPITFDTLNFSDYYKSPFL